MELYKQSKSTVFATFFFFLLFLRSGIFQPLIIRKSTETGEKLIKSNKKNALCKILLRILNSVRIKCCDKIILQTFKLV